MTSQWHLIVTHLKKEEIIRNRLRVDCEQSLFSWKRKTSKRASVTVSVTCELRCHERLARSAGVGRRAKRESETALVSYNDLDATLIGRINDTSALF